MLAYLDDPIAGSIDVKDEDGDNAQCDDQPDRADQAPALGDACAVADEQECQGRSAEQQEHHGLRHSGVRASDRARLVYLDDLVDRLDEERSDVGVLGRLHQLIDDRPQLKMDLFRASVVGLERFGIGSGEAQGRVLPQERPRPLAGGAWKVASHEIGRPYRGGILEHEGTPAVEAVGGHTHRDGQHEGQEGQQRAHEQAGRTFLFARGPLLPPDTEAESQLVRQQHEDGEDREDRPQRDVVQELLIHRPCLA